MNPLFKSILGWIAYFLILFGLIYAIPKVMAYVLDTPFPMAAITSGSMWPELKKGDLVFIQGAKNKESVKIGDIVVYRNQKGFTIHRVVRVGENAIITKGDANIISDAPVKYEDIIGKAVVFRDKPLRIPMAGNINIMLNSSILSP
jgi:signal peptidase I